MKTKHTQKPIDIEYFARWREIGTGMICFYRGHIGFDIHQKSDELPNLEEIIQVNNLAIRYYRTGWFEMGTRKNGNCDFSYYLIRRVERDLSPRLWIKDREMNERRSAFDRKDVLGERKVVNLAKQT